MSRLPAVSIALLVILSAVSMLTLVAPMGSAQPGPTATPTPYGPCSITYTKIAAPLNVVLGANVDVTLTAAFECTARRLPVHLVLVLDGSAAIGEASSERMKVAARNLVRDLDLASYPSIKVGVVEFNTRARTVCRLRNDESAVLRCIAQVGTTGGANLTAGIEEGARLLRDAHTSTLGADALDALVAMAGPLGGSGNCPGAVQAAARARGQGVMVAAVCVGADCDAACLRQVAGSGRYYFTDAQVGALSRLVRDELVMTTLVPIKVRTLSLLDTLGPDVAYVPGSAISTTQSGGPDRWFLWRGNMGAQRFAYTRTLKVRPTRVGRLATNLSAHGAVTTTDGIVMQWTYPVPFVNVSAPDTPTVTASPSATTAPASATPTGSPPTATPTPSVTATAMPDQARAHVPILVRRHVWSRGR
jgi:hypothetical protein